MSSKPRPYPDQPLSPTITTRQQVLWKIGGLSDPASRPMSASPLRRFKGTQLSFRPRTTNSAWIPVDDQSCLSLMRPTSSPRQPFLRPMRNTNIAPSYEPTDPRPSAWMEYAVQRNTIHHRPENNRHQRHLRNQGHQRKPARLRQTTTPKLRAQVLVRRNRRHTLRRNPR